MQSILFTSFTLLQGVECLRLRLRSPQGYSQVEDSNFRSIYTKQSPILYNFKHLLINNKLIALLELWNI